MNNWMRPSMQVPWYIAKYVKMCYAPIVFSLEVQAAYWDTWHKVFREVK